MMDTAGWLLAVGLLVGLVSLVLLFQHRFIYFPVRYSAAQLQEAKANGVQEVGFQTSQGKQAAFFWRNDDSEVVPRYLWLVFGGNGDSALTWMTLIRSIPVNGSGYLLIDYPGYGKSEGHANPQTILENSERALQTLLEKKGWKAGGKTLSVLGHSLGGAAALQFAAKNLVGKIVLISTFTSMDDMVRAQIRVPLGPFLRHRFDNLASLKTILAQNPVPEICLFHGQVDRIVPCKMSRALAELDSGRIKLFEIPAAGHNDIIQPPLPPSLRSAFFGEVVHGQH